MSDIIDIHTDSEINSWRTQGYRDGGARHKWIRTYDAQQKIIDDLRKQLNAGSSGSVSVKYTATCPKCGEETEFDNQPKYQIKCFCGHNYDIEPKLSKPKQPEPEQHESTLNSINSCRDKTDEWHKVKARYYQTNQIDTETPDGFKAVMFHAAIHGLGDIQECFPAGYSETSAVTVNELITHIINEHIYRIKPQRVPQVGDVWEDKSGTRFVLYGVYNCHVHGLKCMKLSHTIVAVEQIETSEMVKYIGQIDLALLRGDES